jgi:hypothetical protein
MRRVLFGHAGSADSPLAQPWSGLERVGAAILVFVLVTGMVGTVPLGILAYKEGLRQELASSGHTRARAVVVSIAAPEPESRQSAPDTMRAEIRWTDRDGHPRHAAHRVQRGLRPGSELTVWTDGRGGVVDEPVTRAATITGVVSTVVGVLTITGMLVVGGAALVRRLEWRRRLDTWDKEWIQFTASQRGGDHQ